MNAIKSTSVSVLCYVGSTPVRTCPVIRLRMKSGFRDGDSSRCARRRRGQHRKQHDDFYTCGDSGQLVVVQCNAMGVLSYYKHHRVRLYQIWYPRSGAT